MRNLKSIFIASAAMAVVSICPSQAADLAAGSYYTKAAPPVLAAVYDWTGLYLGVNGGAGWSHNCWAVDDPIPSGCHNAVGGTAGAQIGYRWQASNWVFGVEAQGNWADLSGSNVSTYISADGATNHTHINSFALFTGQVGYAFNNVLLYVKGGGALVGSKYEYNTVPGQWLAGSTGTVSETRWNPTVGAGLEYGFAPNWTIGAEYNYVFRSAGDETLNCVSTQMPTTCGAATTGLHVKQDLDMALVRLNYRFGGPVVARY